MLFDDPALRQLKSAFSSEKVRKEGFVKATRIWLFRGGKGFILYHPR